MYSDYEIMSLSQEIKRIMEHAYGRLMEACGLRKVELDIMYFIAHAGERDTARDILEAHHISKAHISKSVDNLRQKGYICLVEDAADHRKFHIHITEEGLPVVHEFEKIHRDVVNQLFYGVAEDEKACMKCIVRKVIANAKLFSEEGDVTAYSGKTETIRKGTGV